MKINLSEYKLLGDRDYYYVEITDKVKERNNVIDDILGEEKEENRFLMDRKTLLTTTDLKYAYFRQNVSYQIKNEIENMSSISTYKLHHLSPKAFIKMMEGEVDFNNGKGGITDPRLIEYFRNIKKKNKEAKKQEKIKSLRKNYNCIDSYKAVKTPHIWLPCPKCDLIPLTWEFNNGSSTACGCGDNTYNHFSIYAESIMSYIERNNGSVLHYKHNGLRDNWNHWVKTGEILYDNNVEKELGKW